MARTPEERAREAIDAALTAAGWAVQDANAVNLHAGRGVAIREFPLKTGHGAADYLLYVDRKAAGVVEAKKAGATLTGVEPQTDKYSTGMPDHLPRACDPLPFLYQSTGVETRFTNLLDPEPRSRYVFGFHRPEELAAELAAESLPFLPATGCTASRPPCARASNSCRRSTIPASGTSSAAPSRASSARSRPTAPAPSSRWPPAAARPSPPSPPPREHRTAFPNARDFLRGRESTRSGWHNARRSFFFIRVIGEAAERYLASLG